MNGFARARLVEARSLELMRPFLEQKAHKGHVVWCLKGHIAAALQTTVGDALFNTADGRVMSIELKADDTEFPNLFLETWSNRNLERPENHAGRGSKPGWLLTLGADLLAYHRLAFDEVLIIPLFRLKRWAFVDQRIFAFEEKAQGKFPQPNDTWGRCVPIDVIEREVGFKRSSVRQLTLWDQGARDMVADARRIRSAAPPNVSRPPFADQPPLPTGDWLPDFPP